jgi:chorismate--pyruvate lyase
MLKSYLFQREPRWIAPTSLQYQALPCTLKSWLHEDTSLTQRLRDEWGTVRVHVLLECWHVPYLAERKRLQLPENRLCLVREVVLLSGNTPLILARTIIPRATLMATHGNLAKLGTRPLGEILFSSPSLERQWLGVSHLLPDKWKLTQSPFSVEKPLWGRLTRYSIKKQPMLVSEFFLPSLFEK